MEILRYLRLFLYLVLFLAPAFLQAQDNFTLRSKVKVTKDLGKSYMTLQFEHRTNECLFVRPVVGCKLTPWLKGEMAYEFRRKSSSDLVQKGLVSLTGTLRSGNVSLSLRERYQMEFTKKDGETDYGPGSSTLRSRLTVEYSIPNSILSPYLSAEAFIWKTWEKTRFCAGTQFSVTERSTFDLFYMCTVLDSHTAACQHALGICYYLKL